MTKDKPIPDETHDDDNKEVSSAKQRRSRSTFAPVILIATGVFFLLANIGVIGALDWAAAWRFWPLALIFLGLNVLAMQLRPPAGTIAGLLVALTAVAVFGYLLLSGTPAAATRWWGSPEGRELHHESFWEPLDGVQTAEIEIDLSNYPSTIGPLSDGGLVGGTIFTTGEPVADFELDDGHARYRIGERANGFMFNPTEWFNDEERAWTFGLSPDVPIDLTINAGNGGATADLGALTLAGLRIDADNGRMSVTLPGGDYDARLDAGNGGIAMTLPPSGGHEIRIDGDNGRIELTLPAGMEARVEYEAGNGSINVPDRFERVRGDDDGGVYETAGYNDAAGRVLLILNGGNGAVTITAP